MQHTKTWLSNGVDWERSLWKISTWLRGTSLCINCTSSHSCASSFMLFWNDPKCTQTLCNTPKHELRVQWGGLGLFVAKTPEWLHGTNFRINCTSSHHFAPSFMQLRNDNRWTQTQWNLWKYELGSNGVDWVCSLQKIQMSHRGMNFCINCTCTVCFATI